MKFNGFPAKTQTFLRGLAKNNTREWFNGHRGDYEKYWLGPAEAFVEAAGDALRAFAPEIRAEPRANGSIFRINRDLRFSSDPSPYKTNLDLWFWEGERRRAVSGFFVRIGPKEIAIGAGAHGFDPETLARYRSMVADDEGGDDLLKAVRAVTKAGWTLERERFKKLPRGYEDATGKRAELLLHDALWVARSEPPPDALRSKAFVAWCAKRWRTAAPLHRWLVEHVQV